MRSLDGVTTFGTRHLNKHRETADCARATYRAGECLISVEILDDRDTGQPGAEAAVAGLFAARYPELVRLAGLLGADDPEDIAQEAFTRLMRRRLPEPRAALGYLRAIVVNLTRNRHRHLRVVRMRTPAAVAEGSSEQAAILREDHRNDQEARA
jgi:DNA-directed RNA polymerase specialized sigma24 family protein